MMFLFEYFFIAILGLIIGSFLNVVIFRYKTGRTFGGRSGCLSCGYQLKWYDLIPIVSWLSLKGRCRKCAAFISWQYPLVEFGTALLFVLLLKKLLFLNLTFSFSPLILAFILAWWGLLFSLLIVIFVYDWRHKIIPNFLVYTFAILSFIQALVLNFSQNSLSTEGVWNLLAGPILFLPFFSLWFVSSGKWIGLGDGKLALGIGWFLGFIAGLSAIISAFWLGALWAIFLMFIDRLSKTPRHITMKTEVPFGPFLIFGIFLQFFWPIDFLGLGFFF